MRIGIFSGIFDPVHSGHLQVAQACRNALTLEKVQLVPFGNPIRRVPEAGINQRLKMIRLALANLPGIEASSLDSHKNLQYAIQAVRGLQKHFPGADLFLILGADQAAGIPRWQDADALMKLCTFAVHPKAGYDAVALVRSLRNLGARAVLVDVPVSAVSSGKVRAKLRLLDDARGMLPPPVCEFIAARGLYQPDFDRVVRQAVSPARYQHSEGVRQTAAYLARLHGLPMQKAGVAGILHDNAKCMELGRLQTIARQFRIARDPLTLSSNALLHGPVGAHIARFRYHVADQHILNAIRYHTTGRAGMEGVELCIFVADAIEPNREYPGINAIRRQAEKDLRLAALSSLTGTQRFLRTKGDTASPLSAQAIADLSKRLHENKSNINT